jgi:hypothetical protein
VTTEAYEQLENLSSRHELVVLYEASGLPIARIAEITGFNPNTVGQLRRSPAYQSRLEELKAELRERVLDRATSLAEKFNDECSAAFETLCKVHRSSMSTGSERVRAADSILDRAPIAPKKAVPQSGRDSGGLTIVFGVQTAENIGKSLRDTGRTDLIELYESASGQFSPTAPPTQPPEAVEPRSPSADPPSNTAEAPASGGIPFKRVEDFE